MLAPSTGEVIKRRLEHENGEAKMFYATLPSPARVQMEVACDAPWFERVLREHHPELWIGDAAEIRAAMVRKQKTDPCDALHILDLLLTNCFPRIWVPSIDNGVFCKIAQGVEDVLILAHLKDFRLRE